MADDPIGRPTLLFVSPVIPRASGGGLAMRALTTLETLAEQYAVHLLVIATGLGRPEIPELVRSRCTATSFLPIRPTRDPGAAWLPLAERLLGVGRVPIRKRPREWMLCPPHRVAEAAREVGRRQFDVIHVFRLYLAPFADPFVANRVRQLDLDDVESATRADLAQLYRLRGMAAAARRLAREAELYAAIERDALNTFDRIFVCSEPDRDLLARRAGSADIVVAPNVVSLPPEEPHRPPARPFTVLFVGNFGYAPNADGLDFLFERVVPELRRRAPCRFTVRVVGMGLRRSQRRRLRRYPELDLRGAVEETEPHYRAAGAAIVPLRAGGGTRIKVLEAMALGVPVVSTPKGVAGLEVGHRREALIGATASDLAEACAELMTAPTLATDLARRGRELVATRYHLGRLRVLIPD